MSRVIPNWSQNNRWMSNRGRFGGLNSDCRDQPRVGGFAFFMVTTRADTGDPIGFGGRR